MNVETIEAVLELDERVKVATSQFYNRAVAGFAYDPWLGGVFGEMALSVTDILLVAALGQVHVLMTGSSGRGKTDLAKLFCQGLFGKEGFFLQKLNPHLTEELFADVDMKRLRESSIRQSVAPAPFLSLASTILDECNRTPPALTNVLLGFLDGHIELKCGLKQEVGFAFTNQDGKRARYHLAIGSMNEGREFAGSFELDAALSRRLTLRIPFNELRPTAHDLLDIIELRRGHANPVDFPDGSLALAELSDAAVRLPLDPLALLYLLYLGNLDRCHFSRTGFHSTEDGQELCAKAECRIQKSADGFCPSVGALCEGALIFLKRSACGLAVLRAARTVASIRAACEEGDPEQLERLRSTMGCQGEGKELREAAVSKYAETVRITIEDLKTMLPFVGLGGKVAMSNEYVAKQFQRSQWLALQHYVRETYGRVEDFFRENREFFDKLGQSEEAVERLISRLDHAERFSDPAIRATVTPLLERRLSDARTAEEIGEEIDSAEPARAAAVSLVCV